MKSITLLKMTTGIALFGAINVSAMILPDSPGNNLPKQEHACWVIDENWTPHCKVVFEDHKLLNEEFQGIKTCIVFTEYWTPVCLNIMSIEPFILPEDHITINHADTFCKLLEQHPKQYIAVYSAGDNKKVFLMLVCAAIKGIIKYHFSNMNNETRNDDAQDGIFFVRKDEKHIQYKFRDIVNSNDEALKNLIVDTILNNVFATLFPPYILDSLPSCFTQEHLNFIRTFCMSNLRPTLTRRSSSGKSLQVGKPRTSSFGTPPRTSSPVTSRLRPIVES